MQAVVPDGALEAALVEDPSRPDYLDSGFRLVLAVNKADLLPSVVTRTRLEVRLWVRPQWMHFSRRIVLCQCCHMGGCKNACTPQEALSNPDSGPTRGLHMALGPHRTQM